MFMLINFIYNIYNILQPTPEQYDAIEDSNIINLINLHTALAQIFDKIFLTDFSITDLTSPGIYFNVDLKNSRTREIELICNISR